MPQYTPTVNMNEVRELVFTRKDLVRQYLALPEDSPHRASIKETVESIDVELEKRLGSRAEARQLLESMQSVNRPSTVHRTRDNGQVTKGIGCLAIAVLISLATYGAAADGGGYVVLYGAMIFGAIMIIRGLIGSQGR